MELNDYLGRKAHDVITGFKGTVTAVCVYISGCNQVCLQPPVDDKGVVPDARWYDVQRMELDDTPALKLVNIADGFDAPPPVR